MKIRANVVAWTVINISLLIVSCGSGSDAQEHNKLIDEVLTIVQQQSIKRDSVDFNEIRKEVNMRLQTAHTTSDTHEIIRYILRSLNDHHSFLMTKEQVTAWESTSKTSNISNTPPFHGSRLRSDIAYIRMGGFASGDPLAIKQYADNLQKLIQSLDGPDIKGWIVDVRANSGGNCWPMLTGIGPLLGNGVCGYFVSGPLDKVAWYYRDGEAGDDNTKHCRVTGQPYALLNPNLPVAVLTGPMTASSGEVVVISFIGKTNTKSFGENTAGLSTANRNFELSDGSMIVLATAVEADRNDHRFGGKIKPDVIVVNDSNPGISDSTIDKAIEWIRSH